VNSRFYRLFEKELREAIKTDSDALIAGQATDYTDYRVRVARIKANKDALEKALEVYKNLDKDDDENG
jgi:hypothetical protein